MKRLLLLVAVLAGSLWLGLAPVPAAAATQYTDAVNGTETAFGTTTNGVRTGVTFSGAATGALPGIWTVMVDYTPPSPQCGGRNQFVGGTWTLALADGGMITGTVARGSVTFDQFCALGQVEAQLIAESCTGSAVCADFRRGRGTFSGVLNHVAYYLSGGAVMPSLTGTLALRF